MSTPIMPKATAMWLIDNTALTFEQIADFCGLHKVEIQAMADGQFSAGLQAVSPVDNGQLMTEEIHRCEQDSKARLRLNVPYSIDVKIRKSPKYTPIAKRQDRPRAVAWIVRHYPKMQDNVICSLVSTTKRVVQSIRDRTYPNMSELVLKDPVMLGLCSQTEFNNAINSISENDANDA